MALASIASTEKTEHFIYAILPMAIGLSVAEISSTPEMTLVEFIAIAGIVSSMLSLLLYEVRVDEYIVKVWARWLPRNGPPFTERDYLELSILSWNLLLRTWNNTEIDPPEFRDGERSLGQQIDNSIQSVVSSPVVRRRLWPLRASFYIFWSLPLLIWLALVNAVEVGWIARVPYAPAVWSIPSFWSDLRIQLLTICLWLSIGGVEVIISLLRHKHLKSHIRILVTFRYVQRLTKLGYSATQSPSGERHEFLHNVIGMHDWPTFIDLWHPYGQRLETAGRNEFIPGMCIGLWNHWSRCIKDKRTYDRDGTTQPERTLGWYIYFSHQLTERVPKVNEPCKKLIHFVNRLYENDTQCKVENRVGRVREAIRSVSDSLSKLRGKLTIVPLKNRLLRGLSNPLYVFAKAPLDLLDNSDSRLARYIWSETSSLLESKLSNSSRTSIADKLLAKKDQPYTSEKVGGLILNLMHVCHSEEKATGLLFLPDRYHEDDDFPAVLLRRLKKWDKQRELGYVIALYLIEGNSRARIAILNNDEWRSYLEAGPARTTLERIRDGILTTDPEFMKAVRDSDLWK